LGNAWGERIDTWDVDVAARVFAHGGRYLIPATNMVINHGLRSDGTHTTGANGLRRATQIHASSVRWGEWNGEAARDDGAYANKTAILEILSTYGDVRRLSLLARNRRALGSRAPSWELALLPFEHRLTTLEALHHLQRFTDSAYLAELQKIFTSA
jgi:hypothetical protein